LYSHIPTTADVDQKSHPLTHESASVGARPSSAAPSDSTLGNWKRSQLTTPQLSRNDVFGRGGRGRPRSDRRAFVS